MSDHVLTVARLKAVEAGRAMRIAARRQVTVQPHALVLIMLGMAGEDTSVHAYAVGAVGQAAPTIAVVGDPRNRDAQYGLLRGLLPRIETYFDACEQAGTHPQVWVSSSGAVGHLDTLADRLRFTDDEQMQRLGAWLTYFGERSPIAGQQALMSATGALRLHYATGQQEAEDEHLGALLTWIQPPPNRHINAAVALAEEQPMGFKTDPNFDRRALEPAIQDFHAALATGDAARIEHRRSQVQALLEGVLRPIYAATQRAVAILQASPWLASSALAVLEAEETRAFVEFRDSQRQGFRLPYRDRPKAATLKLITRERAGANVEAGAVRHDPGAREIGVAKGRVLRATLVESRRDRIRPKLFVQTVVLTTDQDGLHLRAPDVIHTLDGDAVAIRVVDIERRGALTWITAEVVEGKRAGQRFQVGDVLDFGAEAPNWNGLGFERARMASRLDTPPWTHSETLPAATPSPLARPNDLVAAVEGLT
jgi:hypothetical protein